jgi:signal transduction histidine kinase
MDDVVNILLVDDEERNLDALEVILEDPGYHLLRANEADKALRLLLQHDVAAIVLDIKMPGVSGFELAQLIKGTKKFRQIPIVFLTAYMVGDQDILAGYGAGAVDYLTKPVNPQVLRHKIAVFAELFRKTRALAELNESLEARVQQRTAELESSEAALRYANQEKDAFLATLAHELRNPLAPLRTGLDILLQGPDPSPAASKVMAAMNRQLDHMVRLIDDLLDISRITRGVLELRKERADLGAIVSQAIETAGPFLDKRRQKVVVRRACACLVEADTTRVCQIIGNLLHNASKYTPAGGEICVEMARKNGTAIVRVIDAGLGIPPEQLERVFDMFTRIERKAAHVDGGLGIGLSISRRLAELHGGSLSAASGGEGQGATFTVTLPALAELAAAPAVSKTTVAPAASGLRIVVIEDNTDAAETLVAWLEGLGHSVRLATTGPDGLDLVRDARPDLVLCDVGLPGMDGVEVCRHIRRLENGRSPVMVALTGWGMDADRRRTGEAGFDHHLVKPVALDKLRALIGSIRTS